VRQDYYLLNRVSAMASGHWAMVGFAGQSQLRCLTNLGHRRKSGDCKASGLSKNLKCKSRDLVNPEPAFFFRNWEAREPFGSRVLPPVPDCLPNDGRSALAGRSDKPALHFLG
jgi:hypothetical protein